MIKKISFCLIVIFLLIECPTKINTWNLNWQFRDINDSLLITDTLVADYNISPDSFNDGPWIDTVDSGISLVHLYINGEEEKFLNKSPTLSAVVEKGTIVLLDTTLTWDECDFAWGIGPYGEGPNVSTKVFYIVNE